MPVRGGRPQDTLALLAVVAGIAAYTIAQHAPTWLAWLEQLVPRALATATIAGGLTLALALVALAACAAALRRRHVRGLLARRETLALVPADTLDPSADGVVRFAAQLVRSRRRGRTRLERPAAAIRVRVHAAPGGRLGYQLQAPVHARSVLRAALGAYPEGDLHDPAGAEHAIGAATRPDADSPDPPANQGAGPQGGAGEAGWDA